MPNACIVIDIDIALPPDIDALIELESALFAEDAGQHDPLADTTWPQREGRQDFETLMASPDAEVFAARRGDVIVGLLVGYATKSSPTRQPVEFAILRSLYVAPEARRTGAATMLTDRFVEWARDRGCAEVHVDHYAANEAAGALYERSGFERRSISRVLRLD